MYEYPDVVVSFFNDSGILVGFLFDIAKHYKGALQYDFIFVM